MNFGNDPFATVGEGGGIRMKRKGRRAKRGRGRRKRRKKGLKDRTKKSSRR